MLVADYSQFSQAIIDGLKEGIYHVGQSKEVAGNLRPAILDQNEHLVKFFTLKKQLIPHIYFLTFQLCQFRHLSNKYPLRLKMLEEM